MVANIRTGATVGGAIRYNGEKVNRGQAEVLFWNRMLDPFDTAGRMSHERCMASFEPFLQANRRTTNTVFHVSLNPSPEDRLTDEHYAGIIYGALTDDGYGIGTPFRSSRIGKDVGYEALQRYYERSKTALKEPEALDELREKIADEMERCSSRAGFCERLHDTGVDAVFRLNAAGRIYGVTFIDHEQGIVANGSLLGRNFSANAFEQQFHAEAKSRGVSWESSGQAQSSSKGPSYPNQSFHPLDSILELADVRAYEEEQQQQIRKRKKRPMNRR